MESWRKQGRAAYNLFQCSANLALQVVIACHAYYYHLCQKDGQGRRTRNMRNAIEQLVAHRSFLLKLRLFAARITTSARKKFAKLFMSQKAETASTFSNTSY